MKFENSSEAIDWMMEHPLKRVYDQYGNYAVYVEESNMVEMAILNPVIGIWTNMHPRNLLKHLKILL